MINLVVSSEPAMTVSRVPLPNVTVAVVIVCLVLALAWIYPNREITHTKDVKMDEFFNQNYHLYQVEGVDCNGEVIIESCS